MRSRLAVILTIISSTMCCTVNSQSDVRQGKLEIMLTDSQTLLMIVDSDGKSHSIGQYPAFPGLDPKQPRLSENVYYFSNGNAIIRIPDPTIEKKIRSWNDLTQLFNIVFVNVREKTVVKLLSDNGRNLRLVQGAYKEVLFLFQIADTECKMVLVSDKGIMQFEQKYSFKVYPDKIVISRDSDGYIIEHDNIDGNEKFLFNEKTGKVTSIE